MYVYTYVFCTHTHTHTHTHTQLDTYNIRIYIHVIYILNYMLQITWLQPCLEQLSVQAGVLAGVERNQDVMHRQVLPAIFSLPAIFRSEAPLLARVDLTEKEKAR